MFLANLGVNWAQAGMNVIYLTLELSESLVAMRVDSMMTGVASREIFKDLDSVEMKVKMQGKKSGRLQIKYMPSGKTPNDVRSYIKEYEVKTGEKVDVLLIDYLDLLMPNGAKISAENLYVKDKYVSEELRNLAMELQCVFDLGFDIDCLRITNLDEDDDGSGYGAAPQSSIMDSIKRNTSVSGNLDPDVPKEPNEGAPIGKVRAETDSTKLRSFLANLGDDDE